MAEGGEGFPKRARLTRRSEFLNLSREGKKAHTSHFVVISKANSKATSRLGLTVSAKVAKAVARNRVKRLVREFFRRHRAKISAHQDIVVIARKGAEKLSLEGVAGELGGLPAFRGRRQK